MKNHLYIILLVLPLIGFGQGWEQPYGENGYEEGFDIEQTNDGGFVVVGTTNIEDIESDSKNIYITKMDENGNLEWSQIFGNDQLCEGWDNECDNYLGYDIEQTFDGGFIICGTIEDFSSDSDGNEIILIKTDVNGVEEWSQIFGGDNDLNGYSVEQTLDGGYIISVIQYIIQGELLLLLKTDNNGNEQWTQTFNHSNYSYGYNGVYSVKQTDDEGYVFVGYRRFLHDNNYGLNTTNDLLIVKTDDNGNEEWVTIVGGPITPNNNLGDGSYDYPNERGFHIENTVEGGYIISGSKYSFDTSSNSIYVVKLNNQGNVMWEQEYDGYGEPDGPVGRTIKPTLDGGYIVCGSIYIDNNFYYGLIKIDENGIEEWTQLYSGLGSLYFSYDVEQTIDGGYVLCGTSFVDQIYYGGNYYIYIIKTDSEGNVETTSTIELPTPTSKRELVKTTNILGQENSTIKNQPMIEIYDDGSVEKKYIIE